MDTALRKDILFVASFIAIVAVWCFTVTLWHPTVSIMVDSQPYRPIMWVLSLAALAVPFSMYLAGSHFLSRDRNRKILLFGIAVLTSTIVHRIRCFIDTQYLFFLGTVIFYILERKNGNTYRKPSCEYWIVVVYILWNLVTLVWTPDLHFGKKYASNFVPLLAYPAMFLAFSLTADELNNILKLFWRIALVAVLLSFLSAIYEIKVIGAPISELIHLRISMFKDNLVDAEGNELFTFNMLYAWSGMGHPSYNAIWALAASVSGFYIVKRRVIGWLEYLFGCFILILLQFSAQSRIGIVMLLLSFAFAILYFLWPRRKVVYSLLATVLLVAIVVFIANPSALGAFGSDIARGIIWNSAFDFISHKPITGTGLGGTTHEYVSSVIGYPWPGLYFENIYAHNQFLGDWMQSGVVGFVLSIAMVVLMFVMALRRRSFTAFVFLLAILLFMFIEMPLRFIQATTLISFFLCLFLHRVESTPGKDLQNFDKTTLAIGGD
ncbi:MAG: O-antigen ligase family protein [Paludibacteraceae bacterium]|nr:O-antigen ligase family protein [Paludibacteraceae bacterium]